MKSSKFRGVCYRKWFNKFHVTITVNKVLTNLGYFSDETEAARAYDKHVIDNNLPYRLNFPSPEPENLIPNTRLIRLTGGMFTIVDDEDYMWLNQFKWYAVKGGNTFYAVREVEIDGRKNRIMFRMHWEILGGKGVDHADHNGLNNQRSNLRFATHSQNMRNLSKQKNKTSIYKGVHFFQAVWKMESRSLH